MVSIRAIQSAPSRSLHPSLRPGDLGEWAPAELTMSRRFVVGCSFTGPVQDGMTRITRRGFVKATALSGVGVVLQGCTLPALRSPFDVAVIGAGMAGMTAARELIRSGLDVVVLEARGRVGGRLETLEAPAPHGLEVGAQMVHGSRAPTWALIREVGIETRPLQDWTPWQWTARRGFVKPIPEHLAEIERRLDEAYHAYRGPDISYQRFLDTLSITEDDRAFVNEKA